MTVKHIYPTGHGMDIEVFAGDDGPAFTLAGKGPFTFANVLLNGIPAQIAVEEYCAAQEPPITPTEPYWPTFTDVDGGQDPTKAWKMTWTSTDRVLISEDSIRVQMYFAPKTWTATAGQTVFTDSTNPYLSKNRLVASVFVNGLQRTTGYTIHASANTLTFNSGLALNDAVCVSFSDSDTFAKALEGSTYRDEILPSDKNLSSVSKPWIMARLADDAGNFVMELSIPSGLKITGVRQGQTAMTQIQQFATLEEYNEFTAIMLAGTSAYWNQATLTIRGATKSPVFSNLVFQYSIIPVDSGAPFECYNCRWDHFGEMFMMIDNRLTFQDPANPSEVGMRKTIFDDCEFSNFFFNCILGVVSGFEMTGCHVHDAPDWIGTWGGPVWLAGADFWGDQEVLMTTLCSYNRIEGCEFDHTNIPECFCSVSPSNTNSGSGVQATNNVIAGNTFTLFKGLTCAEGGYASAGGRVSKCEISDNTFVKCVCPVTFDGDLLAGGSTKVMDSIATDNVFIDQNLAPSSLFWTESTVLDENGNPVPRFPEGVNGPAIWIQACYKCQVTGNHYKQSGIAPDAVPYESAIWLDICDHCKVYERKQDFPSDLPIEHWVVETDSYDNTINNGKPPKKHSSGRCSYLGSKFGEKRRENAESLRQDRSRRAARHHS